MRASAQSREQENRIPTVIESDEDLRKFRQHLKEIVEGAAFRGEPAKCAVSDLRGGAGDCGPVECTKGTDHRH